MRAYLSILLVEENYNSQKLFLDVIHSVPGVNLCNVAFDGKSAMGLLKLMKVLPDVIFLGINISIKRGILFLKKIRNCVLTMHIPVIMLADPTCFVIENEIPESIKLKTPPINNFGSQLKQSIEDHICRLQERPLQYI